ncbi:MAG: hypothetical protein KGL39_44555 [Patescibacteria group bacterium]|nr:hypothetical protein [Patescibacteria group bacterium]
MKKINTKARANKSPRKLTPELVRMLRGVHGLGPRIERAGGPNRAFTSRILSGRRVPSQRWLAALDRVLEQIGVSTKREMVRLAQIDLSVSRDTR